MTLIRIPDLDGNEFQVTTQDESHGGCLENVGDINILVGPNNSGKSRFLRLLMQSDFQVCEDDISQKLDHVLAEQLKIINRYSNQRKYNENAALLSEKISLVEKRKSLLNSLKESLGSNSTFSKGGKTFSPQKDFNEIEDLYVDLGDSGLAGSKNEYVRVYIPAHRGIRHLNAEEAREDDSDFYAERVRLDYFVDTKKVEVFSGQTMYRFVRELLLGDLRQRKSISEYENFLSEKLFNNEPVALIPRAVGEVIYLKIGNRAERPIYDFGDGIQQLIIQTFPLFKHKSSASKILLCIEEPEQNLHPGLQYKILNIMSSSEYKNALVFFTTHSNNFLDRSIDLKNISIFRLSTNIGVSVKAADGSIDHPKTIDYMANSNSELLDSLGVRPSSLLLSNCTIWVEGVHDRKYIQRIISILGKNRVDMPQENIDYAFVEYAGANLSHWSFVPETDLALDLADCDQIAALSLSKKIFLVADDDGVEDDGSKKSNLYKNLEQQLGGHFYRLPCREIENILKENVVLSVMAYYEKCKTFELGITHDEFKQSDYRNVCLGSYIDEKMAKRHRKNYADSSGTIKGKNKFQICALNNMNSMEDLTSDAINLGEALLRFIDSCSVNSI